MIEFKKNSFCFTMLEMSEGGNDLDLFSRACLEQFDERPRESYGYLFAQVFEPSVLREIVDFTSGNLESVEALTEHCSPRIAELKKMILEAQTKSPVEIICIAAALISISRFALAKQVLQLLQDLPNTTRDKFECAMLEFVIANRCSDPQGVRKAFADMKDCIKVGEIPGERALDAASQAVVWSMKSKQLDSFTYDWFADLGNQLATTQNGVDPGAKSSWFRAHAMVPAAKGDVVLTRGLMQLARQTAEQTLEVRPRAYEQHFLKTYHESALKEYMYVSRDYEAAREEAEALIAIDPVWSPSYGEFAEVHRHFGEWSRAAVCFEKAALTGPPYVGHHYFQAAKAHERGGDAERAMNIYLDLLKLDEDNPNVVISGAKLGRTLKSAEAEPFERALSKIKTSLDVEQIKYLSS